MDDPGRPESAIRVYVEGSDIEEHGDHHDGPVSDQEA